MKDPNKLFDFIDIMFNDKKLFNELKPYQKSKHLFMINRFMSIDQPVRANALQPLKINPSEVINFWQSMLTNRYSRKPNWMFTSTKKQKLENKKKQVVEDATITEYCNIYSYSRKQVQDSIEMFGGKFMDELISFEKIMKQ